jgi:hypothetical protein
VMETQEEARRRKAHLALVLWLRADEVMSYQHMGRSTRNIFLFLSCLLVLAALLNQGNAVVWSIFAGVMLVPALLGQIFASGW